MSANEKSKRVIKNDRFTSKLKRNWTFEKLKSNPILFGGDSGNPAIIKAYLEEVHNIKGLTFEIVSESVGVSRHKNKLLRIYEYLDHRINYAIDRAKLNKTKPFIQFEDEEL